MLAVTELDVAFAGAIAGIAGPVVAGVAIIAASRGRNSDQAHTLALAKGEQLHETDLRRNERLFDQRSRVYGDLLRAVMRAQLAVDRRNPFLGPVPPPPKDLTDEEWINLETQVSLFGTAEILAAVTKHSELRLVFAFAAEDWEAEDRNKITTSVGEARNARQAMEAARKDVRAQTHEIERITRDELANL